jgi:hypothetical protein
MSNCLTGVNIALALAVAVLTFVVAKRVLKSIPVLNSPAIPFCVAGLTAISLGGTGIANVLLLPYGALGLALLFIFLLYPFLNDKKPGIRNPPPEPRETGEKKEDPWEKEMRRRKQVVKRRRLK